MTEPRALLLLLWSTWTTGSVGYSDTTLDSHAYDAFYEKSVGKETVEGEWAAIGSTKDGQRQELGYLPFQPHMTLPGPTLPTKASAKSLRLQNRQGPETDPDEDDDSDDDDETTTATPPPATPPPDPAAESSRISSSVSIGVSSSVAAAVSDEFAGSLAALSASASTAIQSAKEAGRAEGLSSATVTTSEANTGSNIASPVIATTTDEAVAIASVQASASKAIENAKASASSSAQSVIEAAGAGVNTAMASVTNVTTQGSSLTPGHIGGIVISMVFIASVLSALATYLLMRRRQRQQDRAPPSKFDVDSPPEFRDQGRGPPNFLHSPMSSLRMFMAGVTAGHPRSPTYDNTNTDFIPDIKQRLPPPPDTDHPAMSYSARPLSMPGPDGFDPVFPISPLSTADGPSAPSGSKPAPSKPRRSSPGLAAGSRAAAVRVSLARQQSINGGKRAQLVRVGSNGSDKAQQEAAGPLALNPVREETGWRVFPATRDAAPTPSATAPRYVIERMPEPPSKDDRYVAGRALVPGAVQADRGTPSPLLVQAPILRRPVNPFSLELGTAR
ncbi:hypothetical protein GGR53DRAFT_529285 [Hypoxylon sp. FL1150]|nr:hypothetical protein GGR53DRAFT_529285 [Hypoxylon sp. FL1150]